jgi:hypothetical protein
MIFDRKKDEWQKKLDEKLELIQLSQINIKSHLFDLHALVSDFQSQLKSMQKKPIPKKVKKP